MNYIFKAKYMSIQCRIKLYRQKGKDLVMKENRNLTEKNKCFRETRYKELF